MVKKRYNQGIGVVAVVIIVAIIALGGAGFYVAMQNNAEDVSEKTAVEEKDSAMMEGTNTTTMRALLGLGQNVTCTYSMTEEGASTSGVVYIAGEKMRGDFQVTDSVIGNFSGHTILKDGYSYFWSDTDTQGTKFKLDAETEVATEKQTDSQSVDLDEEVDFDCNRWSVDNAKFTLPAGIDFVDFSARMQQQIEVQMDIPGVDCSVCDNVPAGAAQDQCRVSLGC